MSDLRNISTPPLVSVVIGVRNAALGIRETVDNVLSQEGVALELIVVDDASTDKTTEILDEFSTRDHRVRVIRQKEHGGLTKALISGCAAARGTYIARQDDGDLSLPSRLAREAAVLGRNPDVAFVSCWSRFRGPDLELLDPSYGTGKAVGPTWLIDDSHPNGVIDGPTHHGAVMFRRSAYEQAGGYRPEFYFGQDWDLWFRIAAIGMFEMIPEELYVARVLPRSLSGVHREQQFAIAEISRELITVRLRGESESGLLERAARIRPEPNDRSRRSEAAGYYFLGESLRRWGHANARHYLREAIRLNPLHVKAWIRLLQATLSPPR